MTKVAHIVAAIVAGFCLTGCYGPENSEPMPVVYNFVTYESTSDEGGESVFTYQVNGDSPIVTLTAEWSPQESIKPGMRLLLAYVPENSTTESGPVDIQSYAILPGGEIRYDEPARGSETVRLNSMWRSGNYLNLDGMVTFGGAASEISLYAEPGSEAAAEPLLTVVVRKADGEAEVAAERRLYASWDISAIWSKSNAEAVRVAYTDDDNETSIVKFIK